MTLFDWFYWLSNHRKGLYVKDKQRIVGYGEGILKRALAVLKDGQSNHLLKSFWNSEKNLTETF